MVHYSVPIGGKDWDFEDRAGKHSGWEGKSFLEAWPGKTSGHKEGWSKVDPSPLGVRNGMADTRAVPRAEAGGPLGRTGERGRVLAGSQRHGAHHRGFLSWNLCDTSGSDGRGGAPVEPEGRAAGLDPVHASSSRTWGTGLPAAVGLLPFGDPSVNSSPSPGRLREDPRC